MAVYNRKDFENFLNKEKIRKQKIQNTADKIIDDNMEAFLELAK